MGKDQGGKEPLHGLFGEAELSRLGAAAQPRRDLGRDDRDGAQAGSEASEAAVDADDIYTYTNEFIVAVVHSDEQVMIKVSTLDGLTVAVLDSTNEDETKIVFALEAESFAREVES